MLWRATVQSEDSSKPGGFVPNPVQAQRGDALFWFNEDHHTEHQPVPDSGVWNLPAIKPQSSSDQLALGVVGTIAYHCATHPDDANEKGSIIVANAVLIAAGANPLFPSGTAVTQGQCVSWGNSDAEAHQPCPNTGNPWFTGPINSGDLSAPVTFADVGTFDYHCALHPDNPQETGSITVSAPKTT